MWWNRKCIRYADNNNVSSFINIINSTSESYIDESEMNKVEYDRRIRMNHVGDKSLSLRTIHMPSGMRLKKKKS